MHDHLAKSNDTNVMSKMFHFYSLELHSFVPNIIKVIKYIRLDVSRTYR